MSELAFHFAILHGLVAAGCKSFNSARPFLDEAYERSVVARMKESGAPVVGDVFFFHKDPMFGVYRAAEDMILFGMQGCLLSLLSPGMTRAVLHLKPDDAKRELIEDRYGGPDSTEWFLETGRQLKTALSE